MKQTKKTTRSGAEVSAPQTNQMGDGKSADEAKLSAVPASAYQRFILSVVQQHGGLIADDLLDEIIQQQYASHWSRTDKRPWGSGTSKPKWVQNVASAKAGLDHRMLVVKVTVTEEKGRKVIKRPYRLHIDDRAWIVLESEWQRRRRKRPIKPQHEPLPQPKPNDVVPALPVSHASDKSVKDRRQRNHGSK